MQMNGVSTAKLKYQNITDLSIAERIAMDSQNVHQRAFTGQVWLQTAIPVFGTSE